jgi:outer membrane usher protein
VIEALQHVKSNQRVGKAALALLWLAGLNPSVLAREPGSTTLNNSPALLKPAFSQRKENAVQKIDLPVFLDGRELGMIRTQIRPEQVEVDRQALAALVEPILQPEWVKTLNDQNDKTTWIDLKAISAMGWVAKYSAQRLAIEVTIPLQIRKTETFSLGARQQAVLPGALLPEPWSWIVNGRLVRTQQSATGVSTLSQRLYPDVAGRWQDWVLEGNGAYTLSGKNAGVWSRQSTRFVRDWPSEALRLTLGDATSSSHASASSLALGGVSLSRKFELNPALPIQSEPGAALSLQNGGSVDVRVNGVLARTLSLGPGVYQLSEIPVFTGANAVELTVVEPGGKTRRLVFDYFYDATLLKSGVSEYEFLWGAPAFDAPTGRSYDKSQRLFSGWWRRGWTQALSAGVSGQWRYSPNERARVAGLDAVLATPLGNLAGWLSQSQHKDFGGYALSGQWRWNHSARRDGEATPLARSISVIVQARHSSQGYAPVSAELPGPAASDVGIRLGLLWAGGYSSSVGANVHRSDVPFGNTSNLSMSLRTLLVRQWSLDGSVTLNRQAGVQDTALGLLLTYTGDVSTDSRERGMFWQTTTGYQSKEQRTVWDADLAGNTVWMGSDTSWQVNANHSSAITGRDTSARARALMGRAEAVVTTLQNNNPSGHNTLLETSLASALVISKGGGWGWAAPVYDSAVQFKPYRGYEGLKLLVDPRSDTSALSSDLFGTPPLASVNAYVPRELQLDVENLPPGLNLGADRPMLLPRFRSVVLVPIGSNARTQVTGYLLGPKRQALALQAIVLTLRGSTESIDLFTNRKGLFLSSQLSPGFYDIKQPGNEKVLATFAVSEEQEGMMDIGQVQILGERP